MCGIVGVASVRRNIDRNWVKEGSLKLSHRGPDGHGEWWSAEGQVGLAHRRLAIVDLSVAGHQPMHSGAGELHIVFNGEIYNFADLKIELSKMGYVFKSHTDTEVILNSYLEWGENCLSRLNGMFAFAIYDERSRQLFMARDRAGEKPLFYTFEKGELRFASELKALMADPNLPRRVDLEALDCYLAMGFVPGDKCLLSGVKKLPPAHALRFNLKSGQFHMWRYWNLPDLDRFGPSDVLDECDLLDELENLLEDSVRRQMVADVPVGVLLSGGVDSSLITALAARVASNVKTFTIRFHGHARYDESEHAQLISRHFGTQHVVLDATDTSAELLRLLVQHFDEPIVDSSMIPTFLVSNLVRQHCTVALGGDGGDELFGGYHHYSRLLWLQKRLRFVPRPIGRLIALCSQRLLPLGMKGRNWLQAMELDLQKELPLIASYFDPSPRQHLMATIPGWRPIAESLLKGRMPIYPDLLQRATRMDFHNYLSEDILVKVDRASMANSLEVRAPMLDYRLIEFAFKSVPSHLKATAQDKKILLKRLASRLLPSEFDLQRKQGFAIPLADWLKFGTYRELFHSVLLDARCPFNRKLVLELLKSQDMGRNNSERLFSLVLFELWRREHAITI